MFKSIVVGLVVLLTSVSAYAGTYMDQGNGTLVDMDIQVMWTQSDQGSMTHPQAEAYCQDLVMGSFDDWRLPDTYEMATTLELGSYPVTPVAPLVASRNYHWSGRAFDDTRAFRMSYYNGMLQTFDKYATAEVLCIRDLTDSMVVEKTGYYTATYTFGEGAVAEVYVNGSKVGEFTEGLFGIGNLVTGDKIQIIANGLVAEEVDQLDWQSWNLYYAGESIVIYVEDPPIEDVCASVAPSTEEVSANVKNLNLAHNRKGTNMTLVMSTDAYISESDTVSVTIGDVTLVGSVH